jgi:hypothetical protein
LRAAISASSASTMTCSDLLFSFSPTANCNWTLLVQFQSTIVGPRPQLNSRKLEARFTDIGGGRGHGFWVVVSLDAALLSGARGSVTQLEIEGGEDTVFAILTKRLRRKGLAPGRDR